MSSIQLTTVVKRRGKEGFGGKFRENLVVYDTYFNITSVTWKAMIKKKVKLSF